TAPPAPPPRAAPKRAACASAAGNTRPAAGRSPPTTRCPASATPAPRSPCAGRCRGTVPPPSDLPCHRLLRRVRMLRPGVHLQLLPHQPSQVVLRQHSLHRQLDHSLRVPLQHPPHGDELLTTHV